MRTNLADRDIPDTVAARREWIKYQLGLRGLSLGKLARRDGVTPNTYIKALHKPYPKSERAIARAIGLKPQQLWPERFNAQGGRLRPRGVHHSASVAA